MAINEGKNVADLVKYEGEYHYSRDLITVASGETLTLGAAVGKQTANGKYYELAPGAADGTEVCAGVLIEDVDAALADLPGIIVGRHAILDLNSIVWPTGITGGQKTTAIAQLKAAGILLRTSA